MTAQGRPYARLKRALGTGNPNIALAAAAELPRVDLADALVLCLLLRDDGERFERAIVRWHARFCLEVPASGRARRSWRSPPCAAPLARSSRRVRGR